MKKCIAGLFILAIFGCVAADKQLNKSSPQEILITIKSIDGKQMEIAKGNNIHKSMEIKDMEGGLSHLTFICKEKKKAFLKLFSGLSVSDVTSLWSDLCWLENNTDIRNLELFINSPGGDAFSGLALADQIERAKRNGFIITAHASGIVASAAVPVLSVCSNRFAAAGTIFMVHEAELWKWPGRETASDIKSQNDLMALLRKRYIDLLVKNSKISEGQWKKFESETTWFSAQQALEWGLIDKIQ